MFPKVSYTRRESGEKTARMMPEGEKENLAGHGYVQMHCGVKSPDGFLKNPAQAKEAATEFSKSFPCSHPFHPK
jgi:hypothetical protein